MRLPVSALALGATGGSLPVMATTTGGVSVSVPAASWLVTAPSDQPVEATA